MARLKRAHRPSKSRSRSRRKKQRLDLISELPQDLLISIISRLPIEEAARTGILSRRFKDLWTLNTTTLCFDNITAGIGWPCSSIKEILNQHRGNCVDSFCVRLCLCMTYSCYKNVCDCFLFSLKKSVRTLMLDLLPQVYNTRYLKPAFFCPLPTINDMKNLIRSVKGGAGFNFLTSLSFGGFRVSQGVLEYLVSNCPCLQRLRLIKLFEIEHLKLKGPLPSFKHMEILHCESLQRLEISSISLSTMVLYGGELHGFTCYNDMNISALTLGQFCCPLDFANASRSLVIRSRELDMDRNAQWNFAPPVLPAWSGLIQLDIRACACHTHGFLYWCSYLIKSCPQLEKLNLGLSPAEKLEESLGHEYPVLIEEEFSNESLKLLRYNGFSGVAGDVDIVKWIVRHSTNIQQIIVDVQHPQWSEDEESFRLTDCSLEELQLAKAGVQELKASLPVTIHILMREN